MFHMMCCGLIESMPKTLRPSSSMKEMSVEYLDSISKDTPLALSHDLPFDAVVLPSGNVRISSFVSACVRGRSSSEISEKDINLSLTTEEPEGAHPDADANVLDAYHGKKFETLLENLRSFIPQAALDSMDAGSNVMGVANFYTITTLFIRITGLAYGSKAFIGKLEDVILCVESILFKYGGNMCRYTVDDKGSGILAAYGIPPQEFDSKEAPTRAVLAAIDIHKMLEIKFQLSSSVGITTGRIFCGVVGGNIRCEFTLHGTRVNLAARLMVAAKRGVLTCRRTHKASKNQVDYDEPIMINVKSFDYPIPVYRAHKKMNEFLPETFERDQTACETELFLDKQLHDRLEKHLRTVASGKSKAGAGLLLIDGEAGFGKSRIIDHVTHFLRNDIPARDRLNIYGVLGKSLSMHKHKKNNTDTYEPWRVVISGILRLQRYGGSINRAAAEISSCFTEDQEMQRRAMSLVFPKTMALDKGEEAQHHEETRAPTHEDVAEAIVTIFRHWQMTLAQLGGGRGVNGGSKKLERLLQESQRPSLRHESSQRSISSLSKGLRRIFTKSREEMHEALTSDDKQATYNAATLHSRTVLIFEDIHAFSSMSINILVKLIGEMGSDRLCFIATVRRYDGSAMGREFATLRTLSTCQTTILELRPWSKDVVERVICSLMQSDSVAPSIVKGIMKKAYAHPFYTLELLGLMKNSGQLLTDAKRCCILANGFCFTDASLPDTVTSLLQSKIKGLGRQDERLRAQIALQIASIIGVHFTGRLLKVIISDDEVAQELGYTRPNEHADLLPETLSLLLSVQYIKKISDDPKDNTTTSVVTGFEGDEDLYRFRSTIIQQAASDMLLYDHRRALHRKIALLLVQGNVLPPESREGIGSSPAQRDAIENSIAQHFYKARKIVSAIRHLSIAGKRSIDHRNYLEAVVSYTRLLRIVGSAYSSAAADVEKFSWESEKHTNRGEVEKLVTAFDKAEWSYNLALSLARSDRLDDTSIAAVKQHLHIALASLRSPPPPQFASRWFPCMGRCATVQRTVRVPLSDASDSAATDSEILILTSKIYGLLAECYGVKGSKREVHFCLLKACRLAEQADSPEKPQLALASVRLADFYTTMPSKREVAFSIYKRLPSLVCSIPEKVHDQELTNIDMGRAVFFIGAGIWSKAKRTLERCYERAKHFEYTFLTDSVTLLFTIERVTGDVKGMIQRCGIMQRDFYGHMAFAFLIAGDVEGGKRLLRDYCDEYSSFTFNLRAREEAWQRSTGSLDVTLMPSRFTSTKFSGVRAPDSASDPSRPDIFLSNLPPTILANTNAAIICVEDGKYSEAVDFALQGLRVFFSEMASSTGAKRFYSLTMAYTCLSAAYQAFCFMDHDHDDVDGDGGGGGGGDGVVVGGGGSDNGAKKTLARDRKEALAFEKSLAKLSNAVPVLAPLRFHRNFLVQS
eukprot:g4858.t1